MRSKIKKLFAGTSVVASLATASLAVGLFFFLLLSACTRKSDAPVSAEETKAKLLSVGRSTYLSSCTACHSPDPKKDGPVGPAVAFSSLELIEKRVLEASYPAGYKPKRETHTMVALPHLKPDIPALHAYLNSL
jgi:mono/diheme cytochrome c family protein